MSTRQQYVSSGPAPPSAYSLHSINFDVFNTYATNYNNQSFPFQGGNTNTNTNTNTSTSSSSSSTSNPSPDFSSSKPRPSLSSINSFPLPSSPLSSVAALSFDFTDFGDGNYSPSYNPALPPLPLSLTTHNNTPNTNSNITMSMNSSNSNVNNSNSNSLVNYSLPALQQTNGSQSQNQNQNQSQNPAHFALPQQQQSYSQQLGQSTHSLQPSQSRSHSRSPLHQQPTTTARSMHTGINTSAPMTRLNTNSHSHPMSSSLPRTTVSTGSTITPAATPSLATAIPTPSAAAHLNLAGNSASNLSSVPPSSASNANTSSSFTLPAEELLQRYPVSSIDPASLRLLLAKGSQPGFAPEIIMLRKNACMACHQAKTSCDGRRPCDRCVRLDRADQCVERPRKPLKKQLQQQVKMEEGGGYDSGGAGGEAAEKPNPKRRRKNKTDDKDKEKEKEKDKEHVAAAVTSSPPVSSTANPKGSPSTPPTTSVEALSTFPMPSEDEIPLSPAEQATADEQQRTLSRVMLKLYSNHSMKSSVIAAKRKSATTPGVVMFLSYVAQVMQPEDFAQLLAGTSSHPASAFLPHDLLSQLGLSEAENFPSYRFNFACSPTEAFPDSQVGVDFACVQIKRVEWEEDDIKVFHKTVETYAAGAHEMEKQMIANTLSPPTTAIPHPLSSPTSSTTSPTERLTADSHFDVAVKREEDNHVPSPPLCISASSSVSASSSLSSTLPSVSNSEAADAHSIDSPSPLSPISSHHSSDTIEVDTEQHRSSDMNNPSVLMGNTIGESERERRQDQARKLANAIQSAIRRHPKQVKLRMQVNREFERLFGYSQKLMRDLFIREGSKALYRLYRSDSLDEVSRWLTESCLGITTEFQTYATCVNKWHGQVTCLVNGRFTIDQDGLFDGCTYSWMPLPNLQTNKKQ